MNGENMINILERVAKECGALVLSLWSEDMKALDKPEQMGAHFSTQADRRAQELGLRIMLEECGSEIVIAEEGENPELIPPDCTVFDPVDGTSTFFNGLDDFSVSLCTLRAGKPEYSATYFPVRGVLVSAARGCGCWLEGFGCGRRIDKIRWHGMLDKTLLSTDVGPWAITQGTFDLVLKPLATRFNIISAMSATEGARKVLMGQVGAFYNLGIAKIWDAAAMALAIQEAGGVALDSRGGPIQFDRINCDWLVAANQQIANIVLEHTSKWKGRT